MNLIFFSSDLDWSQWSLTSQALVFFLVLSILSETVLARPMYGRSRSRGRKLLPPHHQIIIAVLYRSQSERTQAEVGQSVWN